MNVLYDVIIYKQSVTPSRITNEERLYLPEPVASNMNFNGTKVQPRSAFFLDSSLRQERFPGTLHTRLDLRHPIPKLTRRQRADSHVVTIFWRLKAGTSDLARISSIFVSQPLN